jgi:hypothetical protein
MTSALKAIAETLAIAAPDIKDGSGKALEGLVLFSLAAALQNRGATVSARDHTSQPILEAFILRGSPGHLADPQATGVKPSFFAVEFGDQIFELHNSLEFVGASTTEHEMDVAAVWRADAQAARAQSTRMIAGPPAIGVELKEFAASAILDKNIIRAFFACIVDLIPTWPIEVMTMGRPGGMRLFVTTPRPAGQFWVLTSAAVTAPSKAFAQAYDIQVLDQADLGQIAAAAGAMADRLVDLAHSEPNRPAPLPPPPGVGEGAPVDFKVNRSKAIRRTLDLGGGEF